MDSKNEISINIMLVGDSGVGKSCLFKRLIGDGYNLYYQHTITDNYKIVTKNLDGKKIKLKICDTSGKERFKTRSKFHYKYADVILFLYDINDKRTFKNIPLWLEEIDLNINYNYVKILVGTKADRFGKRQVEKEDGIKMGRLYLFNDFYEISSEKNTGIDEILDFILNLTSYKYLKETHYGEILKKNNKCCDINGCC